MHTIYKRGLVLLVMFAVAGTAQAHDAGASNEHGEFEFEVNPGGLDDVGPCSLLVILDDADFRAPVYFRLYLENGTLVEERVSDGGPDLKHAVVFEFSPEDAQSLARAEMNYTSDGEEHSAHATVAPFSCDDQDEEPAPSECPPVELEAYPRNDGSIGVNASGLHATDFDGALALMRSDGGEFEQVASLEVGNQFYTDRNTEVSTTYTYELVLDGEMCSVLEVTAIPVFPTLLAGGAAIGVSMLGYAAMRRRR